MSKERIKYFDELKGLAIIFVVFCHHVVLSNESIVGNAFMSLAWGAVPCFFMVTGGVMHRTECFDWKKYLLRLWKVYLILVIWKLLYLCFYVVVDAVTIDPLKIVSYLFFMGSMDGVDTGPMWFMYAYLQALVIYPITHFLYVNGKKGKTVLMYLFLILWGTSIFPTVVSFIGVNALDSLWGVIPFSGYKNMLCYFILGIFLFEHKGKIQEFLVKKKIGKWVPAIMILLGLVGLIGIKYSYTNSFRWNGIYLDNGYNRLSTMILAVGVYLLFSMELFPKVVGIFGKLGTHTMGIFYLHYPILIVYKKVCYKLIENYADYYSFGLNVLQTLIIVLLCTGITVIAKKIPIIRNIFL